MIDDAISSACGSCPEALKAVLTSQRSVRSIAMEYYVSESTLYRMRKQFYLEYWKMISTP